MVLDAATNMKLGKQSLRAALGPTSLIGQILAGRTSDKAFAGSSRRADPGKNKAITLNSERAHAGARPSEQSPAGVPSRNFRRRGRRRADSSRAWAAFERAAEESRVASPVVSARAFRAEVGGGARTF